jgi:hypothetical protein
MKIENESSEWLEEEVKKAACGMMCTGRIYERL